MWAYKPGTSNRAHRDLWSREGHWSLCVYCPTNVIPKMMLSIEIHRQECHEQSHVVSGWKIWQQVCCQRAQLLNVMCLLFACPTALRGSSTADCHSAWTQTTDCSWMRICTNCVRHLYFLYVAPFCCWRGGATAVLYVFCRVNDDSFHSTCFFMFLI